MTELEKIKKRIIGEAQSVADQAMREAVDEAGKILDEAKLNADKLQKEIEKNSEVDIANYRDRVKSSIDLNRRNKILEAKQEIIKNTMTKALELVDELSDEEYFALIKKLLTKRVRSESGEMRFSDRDLKRLPANFKSEVSEIAEKADGKLVVSEKSIDVNNGFILFYGGIEENCTIEALFIERHDELSDISQKILF